MKKHVFLSLLFLFSLSGILQAQPCSIISDSVVCVNDFISFQVQSSGGGISSYSWDFDDGQTSVQANPFVKYTQYGPKTIRVIIKLSGGGSCTATKVINAHPLPNAIYTINAQNNYCLSRNSVCIDDVSTPGQTNSPIVKRVVLFGDGAADISMSPGSQKKVCHTFNKEGVYTIIMEVTDSKGCINRTQKDVTIVKDAKALFGYQLTGNCDTAALCLFNLTQADSTTMSKWIWDFGNGKKDSTSWSNICFVYRDSGVFSPALIIQGKNGCNDTFRQNQLINLNPIVFDVGKDKYEDCYGQDFTFWDNGPVKDAYFWYSRDSGDKTSYPLGTGSPYTTSGNLQPGKKYISLTVHRGKCISTYLWDSVLVRGPVGKADVRNKSLCVAGDTTYFCDQSDYRATVGVKRMWDFGDKFSPQCISNTAKGQNVGMNCNFSEDLSPNHLYLTDTCYVAELHLWDTVTGCEWEENFLIQIGPPKPWTVDLTYTNMKPCTGSTLDRMFNFNFTGNCYPYRICPDSAQSLHFIPALPSWTYPSLSNPNGNVTVGLIIETGPMIATSCPGITTSPVCRDTIWYTDWFNLMAQPYPPFSPDKNHGCAPLDVTFSLIDTTDPNLTMAVWDWGDGQYDTLLINSGDRIKKDHKHTYLKNGQYRAKLRLVNVRDCDAVGTAFIAVGHENEFEFKTEPCINDCLMFSDSTRYYNDSNYHWTKPARLAAGKEKMWWTFSDGYTDTNTHPVHCFPDTGLYSIQLITLDSSGCYDTSTANLNIGGIKAGIKGKDVILCSEIVQFRDSSVLLNSTLNEQVVAWYWDFGDGTTPSYLIDPYHFYAAYGEFDVRLITYTSRDCLDTAIKRVKVYGPLPSFEFVTDSVGCAPFEVEMENTSSQVKNWIWYFGDPANNTFATTVGNNVKFRYDQPGTYLLKLYGADSIYNPSTQNNQYCSFVYPDTKLPGQIERKVIVLPTPPANFILPDTVCRNKDFALIDVSDTQYKDFRWYFDQSDSLFTTLKVVKWSFGDTGWHKVRITPTYVPQLNQRACFDTAEKPVFVVDILADFDFDPRSTPLDKYFDNLSSGANAYEWDFGHPQSGSKNTSTVFEPRHYYYPETGHFIICLKATNKYGCEDSICKEVDLEYKTHLFIPNVFTPSKSPGDNDAFDIDILGEAEYHLKIYNRWGDLVFETEADGEGKDGINWDGTLNGGGEAEAGVYYVVFDYKFFYTDSVRYKGTLTLLR